MKCPQIAAFLFSVGTFWAASPVTATECEDSKQIQSVEKELLSKVYEPRESVSRVSVTPLAEISSMLTHVYSISQNHDPDEYLNIIKSLNPANIRLVSLTGISWKAVALVEIENSDWIINPYFKHRLYHNLETEYAGVYNAMKKTLNRPDIRIVPGDENEVVFLSKYVEGSMDGGNPDALEQMARLIKNAVKIGEGLDINETNFVYDEKGKLWYIDSDLHYNSSKSAMISAVEGCIKRSNHPADYQKMLVDYWNKVMK